MRWSAIRPNDRSADWMTIKCGPLCGPQRSLILTLSGAREGAGLRSRSFSLSLSLSRSRSRSRLSRSTGPPPRSRPPPRLSYPPPPPPPPAVRPPRSSSRYPPPPPPPTGTLAGASQMSRITDSYNHIMKAIIHHSGPGPHLLPCVLSSPVARGGRTPGSAAASAPGLHRLRRTGQPPSRPRTRPRQPRGQSRWGPDGILPPRIGRLRSLRKRGRQGSANIYNTYNTYNT